MQEAGRKGVTYEIGGGNLLRLYYTPLTQAVIVQKTAEGAKMQVHPIGPPGNLMARIWIEEPDDFYLDRECIGGFDRGGPWVREHRDLEELNEYLALFGLKHTPDASDTFHLSVIEPVNPTVENDDGN